MSVKTLSSEPQASNSEAEKVGERVSVLNNENIALADQTEVSTGKVNQQRERKGRREKPKSEAKESKSETVTRDVSMTSTQPSAGESGVTEVMVGNGFPPVRYAQLIRLYFAGRKSEIGSAVFDAKVREGLTSRSEVVLMALGRAIPSCLSVVNMLDEGGAIRVKSVNIGFREILSGSGPSDRDSSTRDSDEESRDKSEGTSQGTSRRVPTMRIVLEKHPEWKPEEDEHMPRTDRVIEKFRGRPSRKLRPRGETSSPADKTPTEKNKPATEAHAPSMEKVSPGQSETGRPRQNRKNRKSGGESEPASKEAVRTSRDSSEMPTGSQEKPSRKNGRGVSRPKTAESH